MVSFSGLFQVHSTTVENYSLSSGRSPNRYHLNRLLKTRGMRNYREIMTTLLEDVSGEEEATASNTISRVTANADVTSNVQGGARAIEAKEHMSGALVNTDIDATGADASRAVVAGDTTEMQEDWAVLGDRSHREPTDGSGAKTYPANAAGHKNIFGEAI